MKFLVSLLGLGISGGGIFIGTLQQNLSNTKTEIDKLFEEIEQDIRDFSNKNPMTDSDKSYIKGIDNLSASNLRKKRSIDDNSQVQKPKNTLEVWTDIWIQMLDNYIQKLWIGNNNTNSLSSDLEFRVFSLEDKQKALYWAEKAVESEKQRFENKLNIAKEEIEKIYQKMKIFLHIMQLPKKYDISINHNTPYEEYVRKISQ